MLKLALLASLATAQAVCAITPDQNGNVEIPDSWTEIPDFAFGGCTALKTVTGGANVATMGWYAFGGCTSLVTLPDWNSLTTIGTYAFAGCSSLVTLPDWNSLTTIAGGAFYQCPALASFNVGDLVTTIGDLAFYDTTNLPNVCVSSSARQATVEAMYNWAGVSMTVDVCGSSSDSSSDSSSASGDPHLQLAHGGRADFRGKQGSIYNFLSAPDVSLNVATSNSAFKLKEVIVHGSFITEAHLAMRTMAGNFFNLSYIPGELNEADKAPIERVVVASCGNRTSDFGSSRDSYCDNLQATMDANTLTVRTQEWEIKVTGRPIWDRLSGAHHRIDLALKPLVAEEKLSAKPHGLVGQSFDGSDIARQGRLDQYPLLNIPGEFTTSAMAEGAIEGVAADYEVASKYATSFKFGRF